MPLKSGKDQASVSSNISELHKGPNYAKTAAKHGEAVAHKQAIGIALEKARESGHHVSGKKNVHKG